MKAVDKPMWRMVDAKVSCKFMKNITETGSVYRTATLFTFFPSLYDGLHTAGLSLGGLDTFMASLPLAGYGLSWVSFCLAGLILGIILSRFQTAKAVQE